MLRPTIVALRTCALSLTHTRRLLFLRVAQTIPRVMQMLFSAPGRTPHSTLLRYRCALVAALIGSSGSAMGQVYPFETHGKEIDRVSRITPLPQFGEFGDGTDYSSGATAFRKTLVEIPGNNNLRVAADYIVKLRALPGARPVYILERDLPYIEGTHSLEYGWIVGRAPSDYTRDRCSDSRALLMNGGAATVWIKKPGDYMVPTDYWDGNWLYTPDAGGGIVRPISTEESRPSGVDTRWATNSGWRFSCYSLADGSEGFIGHRPNGDKYYFGIPTGMEEYQQIQSPDWPEVDGGLEVDKFRLYITRIEDRFGNWVAYEDGRIISSDGRVITFTPNPALGNAGTVVEANGKQWVISGTKSSFSVKNPDASVWSFAPQSNYISPTLPNNNSCGPEGGTALGYSGQMSVVVKSESGATGTFVFQPRRQGFSHVNFQCLYFGYSGPDQKDRYSAIMHFLDGVALVLRTVSGPGVPTYTHAIDYGPVNACYKTGGSTPPDPCTPSSPTERTTIITGSDGSVRTLTFGNKFFENAGLLLATSEGGLKATSFDHISLYQNLSGSGKRVLGYDVGAYRIFRIRKESLTLQGRTFVREVPSTCGTGTSPCFDSHFRPTKIQRYSAPSP